MSYRENHAQWNAFIHALKQTRAGLYRTGLRRPRLRRGRAAALRRGGAY